MSDEEINLAIAEACGWIKEYTYLDIHPAAPPANGNGR